MTVAAITTEERPFVERPSRVVSYEEFRARRTRHVPRLPFEPPKPRLTLAEAAHRRRMLRNLERPK
jgi:hypothetical protein